MVCRSFERKERFKGTGLDSFVIPEEALLLGGLVNFFFRKAAHLLALTADDRCMEARIEVVRLNPDG